MSRAASFICAADQGGREALGEAGCTSAEGSIDPSRRDAHAEFHGLSVIFTLHLCLHIGDHVSHFLAHVFEHRLADVLIASQLFIIAIQPALKQPDNGCVQ